MDRLPTETIKETSRGMLETARQRLQPLIPRLYAVLFLWMFLALIPRQPQTPDIGQDSNWAHGLNMAHVQQLNFGKDVAFTFGPLGSLFCPLPELIAPLPSFAVGWAVHGLFLLGVFLIWRSFGSRLIVLFSWAILSVAMLLFDLPFERMQMASLSLAIG